MMKYLALVILLLILQKIEGKKKLFAGRYHGRGLVPPPNIPDGVESAASTENDVYYKFTQTLDHFNESETRTWEQRYQVNDEAYKGSKDGPIFVLISGESTIAPKWLYYGQMYRNGLKHNALMFQLEHRFYGESHPTSDASVQNLRYLSSHQALADLDAFVQGMKKKYNLPNAKVAIFGGSYSGNLVVWYRQMYPNSSVGAIASSAPVLAEVDFIEYMETVGNSMKYFNPDCYDAVNDAIKEVQNLVAAENMEELQTRFGQFCNGINFNDSYAIEMFYDALTETWMGTTQYNAPGNTSQLAEHCRWMTDADLGTPLDRYSYWFNKTNTGCIDLDWQGQIDYLKQESWDSVAVQGGDRQWLWQTCAEFAYYQSTDSKNQPFGLRTIDINYLEDTTCVRPFGITSQEIASSVEVTNQKYGAKSPNATRVFLMNGSIDPWHTLAIYEHDLNKDAPSRYIEGTSHCYDMHDALPTDPPQLTQARQDAADQLTEWLGPISGANANKGWALSGVIALAIMLAGRF